MSELPHSEDGRLAGTKVIDLNGVKVGAVTDVVFEDDAASTPSWVVVGYGPFKSAPDPGTAYRRLPLHRRRSGRCVRQTNRP